MSRSRLGLLLPAAALVAAVAPPAGAAPRVSANIDVGGPPLSSAVNQATGKVYVSRYSEGRIVTIDGATNAVTGTFVPASTSPATMDVNSTTGRLFISHQGAG